MKRLSESLDELAKRTKVLEDSVTATFEADRARLEKRRHEIDDAFTTDVGDAAGHPGVTPRSRSELT